MTVILTSANFRDVRVILNITEKEITDEDFNTSGLVTLVNAYLSRYVPDYSVLSDLNKKFAMSAAVYMTAALCTQIIQLKNAKSYKFADYEESNSRNVDWEQLREYYLSMSNRFIGQLTTLIFTKPVIFAVSGKMSTGADIPVSVENWYRKIAPKLVSWFETGFVIQED